MEIRDERFDDDCADLVAFLGGGARQEPARGLSRRAMVALGVAAAIVSWPRRRLFLSRSDARRNATEPFSLTGDWIGQFQKPGQPAYRIRLRLAQTGKMLAGSVVYPTGEGPIVESRIEDDGTFTFATSHTPQFASEPATIRFQGQVVDGRLQLVSTDSGGMATGAASRAEAPAAGARDLPRLSLGTWTLRGAVDEGGKNWSDSVLRFTSQEETAEGLSLRGTFTWRLDAQLVGTEEVEGHYVERTREVILEGTAVEHAVPDGEARLAVGSYSAVLAPDGRALKDGRWGSTAPQRAGRRRDMGSRALIGAYASLNTRSALGWKNLVRSSSDPAMASLAATSSTKYWYGIVHRVHHAIHAEHRLRERNRRRPGHAAGGDVDVLAQVVAGAALQHLPVGVAARAHAGAVHVVDARHPVRQALAQVAEHERQLREAVEHAGDDETQRVQAGLHLEPEDRDVESALEHRPDHAARRRVGMQIDGRVQGLGGLEDRPELRVVQILALGVRVHDDALEPQLRHAALDLFGGVGRILRRDRGQAGEACRVPGDGGRQLIVRVHRQRGRRVGVEDLHARRGQRQQLQVDPGRVHVADPAGIQVGEPLGDRAGPRRRVQQEIPHRALEARIEIAAAAQELAVAVEDLDRPEGFLGGDALVGHARSGPASGGGMVEGRGPGAIR